MNYTDLKQFIAAECLYANVTDAEIEALEVTHYMTEINGVKYVGTSEPVEALAAKQLEKPTEPEPETPVADPVAVQSAV